MNPVELAGRLLAQGRAGEALALTEPLAAAPGADAAVLQLHGRVLKGLNRRSEAEGFYRRATEIAPQSRLAWHNYASVLGDLDRWDEAREAVERAFALGLDAPETWLVYGRANQALAEFDRAETAFREALRRRPGYRDALRDLAQLVWMRTGDADRALTAVGAAAETRDPGLASVRALVLERAGRAEEAYVALSPAVAAGGDLGVQLTAAQLASDLGRDAEALGLAEAAAQAAPDHPAVIETLCTVYLGAGRPAEALTLARRRLATSPHDVTALAFAAVAARLTGDPEYERLYDYASLVRPAQIEPPAGWATLDAYLADLKAALEALHALKAHPLENSLRGGSQTAHSLLQARDPAIQAFFRAVDRPIRDYLASLGPGNDPVRARNTDNYAFKGAWSVRLRPQGFHVDHVHPEGWLSSAFYVETPAAALDAPGREGWIRFGRPRVRTTPPLEPGHFVRPAPGTLVLFPSYMWHGTVPFTTEESRLTVAFDLVPA